MRRKWHPDDDELVLHESLESGELQEEQAEAGPQADLSRATAANPPFAEAVDAAEVQSADAVKTGHPLAGAASSPPARRGRFGFQRRPRHSGERMAEPASLPESTGMDRPSEPLSPAHHTEFGEASTALSYADRPGTDPADMDGANTDRTRTDRSGVRWGWVFLPLTVLALAASWFALPIREVAVSGNQHLSAEEVVRAAGVGQNSGWLYYGMRQASGLSREPWIESAEVTRQFPSRLSIRIAERRPYAALHRSGQSPVAVARDGTQLPGADLAGLPRVGGWGPERTTDALAALEALAPYHVQSVEYTPSGLSVKSAESSAWSGDLESLLKYAGALTEYPNQHIHIYPWGVSVQE